MSLFAAVLIAIAGSFAWLSAEARTASATVIRGDGHGHGGHIKIHSGNGKFNKSFSTVLSPTVNRGLQQVSNTNVSGRTSTQVGFCVKKHRVCKISQRLR